MPKKTEQVFYLKITNPQGLVFGGNAKMFSSENKTGKFDILPHHTNFISTIAGSLKITTDTGDIKDVKFEQGLVRVANNVVDVYLGV